MNDSSDDEDSFITHRDPPVDAIDNLDDLFQNNQQPINSISQNAKRRWVAKAVVESSSDDDEYQAAICKRQKRHHEEHVGPSCSTTQQPECSFKISTQEGYVTPKSPPASISLPPSCSSLLADDLDLDSLHTPLAVAPHNSPLNTQDSEWVSEFHSCSGDRRLSLLTALVCRCSHRELVHLQVSLQPFLKKDFLSQLPPEIGLKVLACLSPRDLLTCAKVCHRWREISEDDLLWWHKCHEEGGITRGVSFISNKLNTSSSRQSEKSPLSPDRDSQSDANGSGSYQGGVEEEGGETPHTPPEVPSSSVGVNTTVPVKKATAAAVTWKMRYLRRRQIKCNWRKGTDRSPLVLKGHQSHVITCLEFHKNCVISASDDATIKVWDLETGRCLQTLYGHIGGVWSSVMVGDLLVSGSTDRSVRVWDLDRGVCLHALFGHISTVRCLASWGRKLVSGSRDTSLRVWDVDAAKCLHVLQGHRAAVRCVQFIDQRIVSGSYDYTVRLWDAGSADCLHVLSGHMNRVYTLVFDGHWIASGSLDTTIRVWDAETGAHVQTFFGHESLTSGMELVAGHLLVSSNADATVRVWDIKTGQCCHILAGANKHSSAVTCVQVRDGMVISASDDGTVKLWDLTTGLFLRTLIRLDSGGAGGVVWRILASETRLVCAAGSRNGAEDTKLLVLDFDGRVDDNQRPVEGGQGKQQACQRYQSVGPTLSDLLRDS